MKGNNLLPGETENSRFRRKVVLKIGCVTEAVLSVLFVSFVSEVYSAQVD